MNYPKKAHEYAQSMLKIFIEKSSVLPNKNTLDEYYTMFLDIYTFGKANPNVNEMYEYSNRETFHSKFSRIFLKVSIYPTSILLIITFIVVVYKVFTKIF